MESRPLTAGTEVHQPPYDGAFIAKRPYVKSNGYVSKGTAFLVGYAGLAAIS
jgi:hypothetical protein